MRWLVSSSLTYRYLVVVFAIGTMAYGSTRVNQMPVDVFPEFAPPFVEVQTEGPGMSTEEIESLITIPLEQSLNSTPGLDVMRSKSVPGVSAITLVFKRGTDSLEARQLVNERLAVAMRSIPTSAGIPWIMQPLSATSRVMKIGLSSSQYSLTDLSMIAYWTIRWRLMAVPGVANVVIWGDRFKQLQLQVDPERLRTRGVTLEQAMDTTSNAFDFGLLKYTDAAKNRVGGFVETPSQRLGIHHSMPDIGPDQLAAVRIENARTVSGTPLVLGDIGRTTWGHQPLIGDAVVNDQPGLLLVVEKFPWANTLELTRGVEDALTELHPGSRACRWTPRSSRPLTSSISPSTTSPAR